MQGLVTRLEGLWARLSDPEVAAARSSNLKALMSVSPRPLLDPAQKLIVLFSAKSACSNVVLWFLHQIGKAQAARDYHTFPHRYRREVYYNSELYRQALRDDLAEYRVVRVVRDPFDRAVSSFRHLVRYDEVARAAGLRDVAQDGLSFAEFLDRLERLDLRRGDVHLRIQRHPVEARLPPAQLINVTTQNLFERLNETEAALGLQRTDFKNSEWVRLLSVRHQPAARLEADDVYTRRFTRREAIDGPWPSSKAFLIPQAREGIARLYAPDIEAYGIRK